MMRSFSKMLRIGKGIGLTLPPEKWSVSGSKRLAQSVWPSIAGSDQ